jgi:eukaryotic-like serine/threonine-protein kinase
VDLTEWATIPAEPVPIGHIIADRFELERYAGAGGMGTVYRARDRFTGHPVALKILHARGSAELARFSREVEVLAQLTHPAIPHFVAQGRTDEDAPYVATEWLDGESLTARLERGGLTIAESLLLTARVAEALGEAHRLGFVHRDIKPSNLLLSRGRVEDVKILDFGLAWLASGDPTQPQSDGQISALGYMAPEQANGEAIDGRADLFSLGCVLFRCLAGRAPFDGDDVAAVRTKLVNEDAPRLSAFWSDAPEALVDFLARMLSRSPSARPASGDDVAQALATIDRPATGEIMSTRSGSMPALTTTERPVLCLVLVKPSVDREPVSVESPPDAPAPSLRAALMAHGSHLASLTDRSLLITVPSAGAFTDQATLAARAALAVKALDPEAKLAVVAGRSDTSAPVPISGLIDHGADLLQRAAPGVIRIDEVIAGLIARTFDLGGGSDGLCLLRERALDVKRTLLGRMTPFLGRDRELNLLETIFDEVASEKVARAVLVTAPAGVGKTRLRLEFLSRIKESRGAEVEVWFARGEPMRAGSPFGLLAPMIREIAGVRVGEPLEVRQQKLLARLGRHLRGSEKAHVAMFLGELAGAPFPDQESVALAAARKDATLMGDQMRRAFETFVAAEAEQGPLIVVLEDVHWSDRSSLQFIDHLLRALQDRPFMTLALARPDVSERFPGLWAERPVTSLKLPHLARKASTRLVQQVLGADVSQETVARIVGLADGDAFYLEELIRAVAEGKGEELPETVLAMVQERLEGLDLEARRLLRAASVFGKVFWSGGVTVLIGGEARPAAIAERLHDLVQREIIQHQPVARFPDQDEYSFRQELVREAAYALLTDADRSLGHRLAGEWLERAGDHEPGLLGEHFERGGELLRALTWYRRAAEKAFEGDDLGEVLRWTERAFRCAPLAVDADGATRVEIGLTHRIQAEALRMRGDLALAEPHALSAQRLLPHGSEPWFAAVYEVSILYGRLGRTAQLIAIATELRDLWSPQARSAQINATARAAEYLIYRGEYALADELLAQVEAAAPSTPDPWAKARVLVAVATRALVLGDFGRHQDLTAEAIEQFTAAGDLRLACRTRVPLGYGHIQLGAYAEAEQKLREAIVLAERLGLPPVIAYAKHNLGFALARRGALEEARAVEIEAVQRCTEHRNTRLAEGSRVYLALIMAEMGDIEAAEQEATTAVEALSGVPPAQVFAFAIRATIRLSRGNTGEALADARKAHQMLTALGGIDESEAVVRLAYAEALYAEGDIAAAKAAIGEARAWVLERAEKLTAPGLKAQFLEQVPENKKTLELAETWGPG